MELKELCEMTLNLFDVEVVDDLGKNLMRACKDNDMQKFESFAELVGNLDTDWLQKIFQYYQADRKEKMQDYTPESLADFVGRLAGDSDEVINLWRKTHMLACGMKATFFDLT